MATPTEVCTFSLPFTVEEAVLINPVKVERPVTDNVLLKDPVVAVTAAKVLAPFAVRASTVVAPLTVSAPVTVTALPIVVA